jgi:hypothetical protein
VSVKPSLRLSMATKGSIERESPMKPKPEAMAACEA